MNRNWRHYRKQGRRQNNFQGGWGNEKTRPKNIDVKLPLLYQYHVWKSRGARPPCRRPW